MSILHPIEAFKTKAREWATQVVELQNTKTPPGPLSEKKATLLKWAGIIKKGVEKITGSIDELDNVGVGIAPLIPIAVIAAATAAMAKWITDYIKFKDAIALQKDLTAAGTTPARATEMITSLLNRPAVSLKTGGAGLLTLIGGFIAAKTLGWIK